jgi:hypothetical protein
LCRVCSLFQGLQEQRTRAMNRLLCFRFIRQLIELPALRTISPFNKKDTEGLLVEFLLHVSSAFIPFVPVASAAALAKS